MMTVKRFSALLIAALFAISAVMGQSGSEMSIEESYLQEQIELMIIRETSRSDSRDQKMMALEYIDGALKRGSTNDELRTSLEYLSLEGTQNVARESGRVVNNYPDVRRQAAKYLGTVGTKEAKNVLIRICSADNEPMVLQEAVKSLGTIGINDNDDAVSTIVWVTNKFQNNNIPSDLLALSAVESLEKIVEKQKRVNAEAVQLINRIIEGPYAGPVKARARLALNNMIKYSRPNN